MISMDLSSLWDLFAGFLGDILPTSPFRPFLDRFSDIPYLGYLNWFVPIKEMLVVMLAWVTAVGLFYLYSIVLRWVKVIGD